VTRILARFRFLGALVLLASLVAPEPASAQYDYHFGRNKIQYENFDWQVLKTEHFDVYYYPEMRALAEQGAHFAEQAYDELQNRFQFGLTRRVPLIFYSSNIHFKQTNVTPGFIPDGVGGFFEFLKGRVVVPSNGDLHRFRRVIRHELTHVYTHAKVYRVLRDHRVPTDRYLPLWFTEGIAEYWSGPRDHQHEMTMRDALYSNYLQPLPSMFRIRGTFQMYKQGESLFHFIEQTYGEEKILELIENFWKHDQFENVMEDVLGQSVEKIDRRWRRWLKEFYYPELEKTVPPSLASGTIAREGFNVKPAYYRFSDGTRKVYFMANRNGYTNLYEVPVDSAYQPTGEVEVLVAGEREERFEAFHLLNSRISTSEDGKLAFVTKSGGRDVVHVYDLEADEMEATYQFENLIAVYSPSWGPEGERLAFSSIDKSGYSDLYLFDASTGQLQRLTNDIYDDRDPDFGPNGEQLAFSSDRTATGKDGSYNLFTYDLNSSRIAYVTYGEQRDFAPRWSPSGEQLVFTSVRPDSAGRYGARNIWSIDMERPASELVSAGASPLAPGAQEQQHRRRERRLTHFTTAAFNPTWTPDDRLLFSTFENRRFSIRQMGNVDSLLSNPRETDTARPRPDEERWAFGRMGTEDDSVTAVPYEREYSLDVARGQVSNNSVWGTSGGAVVAFSDLLGNDYWYFTLYNTGRGRGNFLENLSFAISRVQLSGRANIGYGIQRFSGLQPALRDIDADGPYYRETLYGGSGSVSYPLSKFRRIEVNTSLNWSSKDYLPIGTDADFDADRDGLLLSNTLALTHDNALYGANGPVDGWRARLEVGYTTDVMNSLTNYYTLTADVRNYWRLVPDVTFASRGLVRANQGRNARLFLLGGSWDLRGFELYSVRGQKMWFTSQELRFPILEAPYLYMPLLRPFGIVNLRGALFADAAHAWNGGYYDEAFGENTTTFFSGRIHETGQTLGSVGAGLRLNLFGGIVLRYDVGYRYREGFTERIDDGLFRQFFFGYDF
jgi:Tol biopolymer transport system component